MSRNVIVMTGGLAGSSVVTALIARAGYWTGETHAKRDYDTHENQDLIRLNKSLLEAAGYHGQYTVEYHGWAIELTERAASRIDPAPYQQFLATCDQHQPWIWKDPRLWLTIRAWEKWLDLDQVDFVLVKRNRWNAWISATLRRHIESYEYSKWYGVRIEDSIKDFFHITGKNYVEIDFDALISTPQASLDALNGHLGTTLTLDDLRAVYRGELGNKSRTVDTVKALLIYLKNFHERRTA